MAAFALLLLAGCGAAGTVPTTPARQGVTFVPDANGLGVAGRSTRIDFGRSPSGVIPVMEREVGQGRDKPLANCPSGVVRVVDYAGLELSFSDERFVGWRQDDASAGQTCA
ncbi:hypothetical protein KJP29_18500 [Maritimibacter sp. DP1N21-5]|nr:hypothetical protein [Maritimibacter sp. DP1N21-5]